jgi:hypothetical protein
MRKLWKYFREATPTTNPPIWANQATPPVVSTPKLPSPPDNCIKNHNPRTIWAGTTNVVIKIIMIANM